MDIELSFWWSIVVVVATVLAQAIVTWRNPLRGAAVVVFFLPAYIVRIRLSPLPPTNMLEVLVLVFFATTALRAIARREIRHLRVPKPFAGTLLLLVTGASVSAAAGIALAGGDSELSRTILGSLKGFILIPALFTFALVSLPATNRSPSFLLRASVWSAIAVSGTALFGGVVSALSPLPFSFLTYDGRLRGWYLSPNHLAMYLLPAMVLLAGNPKLETRNVHLRWTALAVATPTLLWTKSAGAIVGVGVGVGALLCHRHFRDRISFVRFGKAAVAGAGFLFPALAVWFSDIVLDPGSRTSFASRVMIWRSALEMLKRHWLFGIGPGAFQYHYLALQERFPPYLEWAVPQPHNLFLAVWLQTGLLGVIGFLGLVGLAGRRGNIGVGAALLAILVYGFVDTPFFKNDLAVLFLLLSAIAAVFPRTARERKEAG